MAAGGAGRSGSNNNGDKYGDVWSDFRFGIEICDDIYRTYHPRLIQLDPTRAGKWNRYFIYKNFNIQERTGQCAYRISGLLIDNYGQPYPIDFKSVNDNPMSHSTYPTIAPLIIQPDDTNFKKLTRAQIDYVKVTGKGLSINDIDNIKRVFCASEISELQTIIKENERTHAECMEELARVRTQLELSTLRESKMRNEIVISRMAAADATRNFIELERRCKSAVRSANHRNNNKRGNTQRRNK